MFSNSYDERNRNTRSREEHSESSSAKELTPAKDEEKYYFIFHSILSSLCFTLTIYFLEFDKQHPYSDLYWVFSLDFLIFYFVCIGLSYLFSILSRSLVYMVMYFYYKDMDQSIKPWGELESSTTGIFSYYHLLQTLLGMLIYCIGVVTILQTKFFEDNRLLGLIICYLSIQFLIDVYAYYKAKKRRERKKLKYQRKYEKYSKK